LYSDVTEIRCLRTQPRGDFLFSPLRRPETFGRPDVFLTYMQKQNEIAGSEAWAASGMV
jgi:hypothetical protein